MYDDQPYTAVDEVYYDLGSILTKSQDIANAETEELNQQSKLFLKQELEELKKKCPPEWQEQGAVSYLFAGVYSELGEIETAIDYYKKALSADGEDSCVCISAGEQLANLEVRLGGKQNDPKLIEKAIERLEHLIAFGKTIERLSLLGNAHKRLAMVQSDRNSMTEKLTQAASYYKDAALTGVKRGRFDPHHGLNWIFLEVLLGNKPADAESWLARCQSAGIERYATSHSLRDALVLPDADIASRLLKGDLEADLSTPLLTVISRCLSPSRPHRVNKTW